jgi:hypothetical protein
MAEAGDFDLERFDDVCDPEKAGSFAGGLEALEDEKEYDFVILSGAIAPAGTDKKVELKLQVIGGPLDGHKITRDSVVSSHDNMNHVLKDMKTLGFDSGKWNSTFGRKISVELPKALTQVAGIRFRGKKVSKPGKKRDGTDSRFHNIYINKKLAESGIPGVPDQPNGQPGQDKDDPFGE